jgi:hypothetical protein
MTPRGYLSCRRAKKLIEEFAEGRHEAQAAKTGVTSS